MLSEKIDFWASDPNGDVIPAVYEKFIYFFTAVVMA